MKKIYHDPSEGLQDKVNALAYGIDRGVQFYYEWTT